MEVQPVAGSVTKSWRGLRLKMAVHLPLYVLRRYHAGFLRQAARRDSEAEEDLVGDGVAALAEWDSEWPAEMSPPEFLARATTWLVLFYRSKYRRFHGVYQGREGPRRKPGVVFEVAGDETPAVYEEVGPGDKLDAQEILDGLPANEAGALWAVKGEGLSAEEVAEVMGVRRETVQRWVTQALDKVRG
jgi:DNA-directed RNA polymerase specialized sigma24 family protein